MCHGFGKLPGPPPPSEEKGPGADICLRPRGGETAEDVLARVARAARAEFERDCEEAHAEGMHDGCPREGCPSCEDRRGRVGP